MELHAGPVAFLPEASLHVMLVQHLDWTSVPSSGNLDMELAISRDGGVRFTRPFRRHLGFPFFLAVNPEKGKFDSGTMWTNAQFIPSKDGSAQRLYYGAYESWSQSGKNTGVGAAQMTTHRFAALTPMNASFPATITLRAMEFRSVCAVTANIDTTTITSTTGAASSLAVELMSEDGYVIDGFSRRDNTMIPAGVDGLNVSLKWNRDLPISLPDTKVMIRAHLNGEAKLFALNVHACASSE